MDDLTLYQPVLDAIVDRARALVAVAPLPPAAFLLCAAPDAEDPLVVLPIRADSDAHKDTSARLISAVAATMRADAICCVMESWTLPSDAARLHYESRGDASIADHPERLSVVTFSLETRGGVWCAMASLDDSGPQRELGPVTFHRMHRAEGRFMDLLPRSPLAVH